MTRHDHAPHSWSERAEAYGRGMSALEAVLRPLTEAMLDAAGAGPGVRLLDLACGPGHASAAARARGAEALGVDVTPEMVEVARRRFPDVRFAVGDMRAPPPGPWDAITCRLGAHHVEDGWLRTALDVLAPGGRLAIAELAPADEPARRNGMRPPEAWVGAMERAGFAGVVARRVDLPARAADLAPATRHPDAHLPDAPAYVIRGEKAGSRAGSGPRVGAESKVDT